LVDRPADAPKESLAKRAGKLAGRGAKKGTEVAKEFQEGAKEGFTGKKGDKRRFKGLRGFLAKTGGGVGRNVKQLGTKGLVPLAVGFGGGIEQRTRRGEPFGEAIQSELKAGAQGLREFGQLAIEDPGAAAAGFVRGAAGVVPQAYKIGSNINARLGGAGDVYDIEQDPFNFSTEQSGPAAVANQIRNMEASERQAFFKGLSGEERQQLAGILRQNLGLPTSGEVPPESIAQFAGSTAPKQAVSTEESPSRPQAGLRVVSPEVGPPSFREFEFTSPTGGVANIQTEGARPDFARNVDESFKAGAYDPISPERVASAQRVQAGRARALRGLRELSAARLGVPEYALDAVRQGRPIPEAPSGAGGLRAADVLKLQQGERQLGLRQRQIDTSRATEYRKGFESERAEVREATRERAVTDAIRDPEDEIATNAAAEGIAKELIDKGDPGILDMLLPFGSAVPGSLRGSPQGILDPDTEASAVGVLSGKLQQGDMKVKEEDGVPTLFAGDDPVAAWGDLSPRTREFLKRRGLIQVQLPGSRQE